MTPAEHSCIIYLLDALEGAPNKCDKLLRIAERKQASSDYFDILDRINLTIPFQDILLDECKKIRRELL